MDTPTDRATGAAVAIDMAPEGFRALDPRSGPRPARRRRPAGGGADAGVLLGLATDMMFEKWRLNGHPRSWGYVIGTPAPIGMLGDFSRRRHQS